MYSFFKKYRALYIWFLAALTAALLFHILKGNKGLMTFIADNVTSHIKSFLMKISYLFSFSLAEPMVIIVVVGILIILIVYVCRIIRGGNRLSSLWKLLLILTSGTLSIYSVLCFMFGVNYYADNFQNRSGIYSSECTVDELYELTVRFAEKASEYGKGIERNSENVFSVSQDDFFSESVYVYSDVEEKYPFLFQTSYVPKKLLLSKLLSYTNFTGFYFPFTAEANINSDAPDFLMPFTIAHEMAHQRGVASEDEANFVGILACITCGNDVYTYSGYLGGYIYLSNALYSANYELWQLARERLSDECIADLTYNSSYWSEYMTPVAKVSEAVYDDFLKSYGNESGTRSYGEVVDLLTAYFDRPD